MYSEEASTIISIIWLKHRPIVTNITQGTVFIPTNEAFKLLPGDKMDQAISADLERST